jgi:hypothetical protein
MVEGPNTFRRFTISQVRKVFKEWGFPKVSAKFIRLISTSHKDARGENFQLNYKISHIRNLLEKCRPTYNEIDRLDKKGREENKEQIARLKAKLEQIVKENL